MNPPSSPFRVMSFEVNAVHLGNEDDQRLVSQGSLAHLNDKKGYLITHSRDGIAMLERNKGIINEFPCVRGNAGWHSCWGWMLGTVL